MTHLLRSILGLGFVMNVFSWNLANAVERCPGELIVKIELSGEFSEGIGRTDFNVFKQPDGFYCAHQIVYPDRREVAIGKLTNLQLVRRKIEGHLSKVLFGPVVSTGGQGGCRMWPQSYYAEVFILNHRGVFEHRFTDNDNLECHGRSDVYVAPRDPVAAAAASNLTGVIMGLLLSSPHVVGFR